MDLFVASRCAPIKSMRDYHRWFAGFLALGAGGLFNCGGSGSSSGKTNNASGSSATDSGAMATATTGFSAGSSMTGSGGSQTGGTGSGGSANTTGSPGNTGSGAMGGASSGGSAGAPGSGGSLGGGGSAGVGGAAPAGVDVLLLVDVSGSTCAALNGAGDGCATDEPSRLELTIAAIGRFLAAGSSEGMAVGLQSFGADPIGSAVCDPAHYATPLIEPGLLPANLPALQMALAQLQPTGETPTGAALRGSCTIGRTWQLAHPERETVLLLVTDGEPQAPVSCPESDCCPTLSDAALAAAECNSGATPLRTYVLAVGPSLEALTELAESSGTSPYFATSPEQLDAHLEQFRADAAAASEGP